MLANLLAALAVVIALQALRLAAKDRIVIQVLPESLTTISQSRGPELPAFLNQAARSLQVSQGPVVPASAPVSGLRSLPAVLPLDRQMPVEASLQPGLPVDVHRN